VLVSNGLITLHESHMIKPGNNAIALFIYLRYYFYYLYFCKSCML